MSYIIKQSTLLKLSVTSLKKIFPSLCNLDERCCSIVKNLKKSGNEEFDVPMECFDGAEVCELVGVYILHLLKTVMRKENVGLYRDDGLGILRNSSGPEIERKRNK